MDRARRAMPIGNKQCHAKHVKANQDKHRQNLATVKPSIDNRPPQRFSHLQRNQKKEQMMVREPQVVAVLVALVGGNRAADGAKGSNAYWISSH